MNLISEMFREIEIQRWNYDRNKRGSLGKLAVVIHPDFYYDTSMRFFPVKNSTLYDMEIALSTDIKPNEFIIGEKFSVEEEE